jgi:hypothetical protein
MIVNETELKSIKITYRGLFNLLNCYYTIANQYSTEFQAYESSLPAPKENLKPLFSFFFANPIDFKISSTPDNTRYLSMLHMEILKVWRTGYTAVKVEIHQKTSSCVLLALAMRNKTLAEQCNLISNKKSCPYTYCMLRFPEFYSQYKALCFDHDKDALNFLSQSRGFHEYAITRFTYTPGQTGREDDFFERWFFEKKVKPNASTVKVLKWFASVYEDFLDYVFPGLISQIRILLKLVELVVRESNQMSIRNLYGEQLSGSLYIKEEGTLFPCDPVNKNPVPYKFETINLSNVIQDHQDAFLPFFMCSLDDALIDKIIDEMKVSFNIKINHSWGSFHIHPNHIDAFYSVISVIYTSQLLYNAAFHCIFSEAYSLLSLDKKTEVIALRKQFEKNSDGFEDLLFLCAERYLYQPKYSA